MLGDLNTSVGTISESQLDALFNETPEATPNAGDLKVGVKEGSESTEKATPLNNQAEALPMVDVESILGDKAPEESADEDEAGEGGEGDEDKAGKDGKKPKPAKETKPAGKDKPAKGEKESEKASEAATEVAETIKSTVEYLITKGIWKDFDGREEIEWTEDLYAELAEAQNKAQVEELYNQRKQAAGDYGQAIIDYIENGGDPDQVIDLFKEQKQIQQFDISTDEAREELITRYYKDTLGWKPDRIRRAITALHSEEDGLENEAKEIKDKYDAQYREQLQQLQHQQQLSRAQEEKKKKAFEDNLTKVIDSSSLDESNKGRIKNALFRFNQQLPDGSVVNELYLKFAELQNDPSQYVEFAEWVLDRDNYIKRRATELANTVAEKTFKFVKGGAAKSNKGTATPGKTDETPRINFGGIQFK